MRRQRLLNELRSKHIDVPNEVANAAVDATAAAAAATADAAAAAAGMEISRVEHAIKRMTDQLLLESKAFCPAPRELEEVHR